MKIEIIGTGCPKCKKLEENVRKALEELRMKAEIAKVMKIEDIIERGVMVTPGLAIDGELKSAGRVLSAEEVKKLIEKT
ncbi:MAG: thioredoxin family protein [Halobacteria archaeon]